MVNRMPDEQFFDWTKENNRELHSLTMWQHGIDYESKSSFRIAHEIINQVVRVEELESMLAENPASIHLQEQFAFEKMKLEMIFNDFENKIDSFGQVIKMFERDVEKYESLAELCKKKAKSIDNHITRFKQNIVNMMTGLDLKKAEGTFFTMTLGKPTKSVVVNEFTDEELETIDQKFVAVKKSIDKKAVKDALENGEVLAWATLSEKQGVRIS